MTRLLRRRSNISNRIGMRTAASIKREAITRITKRALAIIAFKEANGNHHYDELLAAAEKFVKKEQWDEDEGKSEDNVFYGGAGYGGASRPDLSNTGFLLDALHELGRGDDDPAIQKALIFVSRSQNLKSKYNTEPFADKVNDGGFIYSPVEGGQSPAGKTDDGGLRSYGSMTYAGFKSMIYAGVKKDDPRVKAAHEWIQKHYTLDENPGMGAAGLYYYYHTFAKALDAIGDDTFVDGEGKSHNWRAELADKYIATQKPDGSWVNDNKRWMETDPNLVTAYGLLCFHTASTNRRRWIMFCLHRHGDAISHPRRLPCELSGGPVFLPS